MIKRGREPIRASSEKVRGVGVGRFSRRGIRAGARSLRAPLRAEHCEDARESGTGLRLSRPSQGVWLVLGRVARIGSEDLEQFVLDVGCDPFRQADHRCFFRVVVLQHRADVAQVLQS